MKLFRLFNGLPLFHLPADAAGAGAASGSGGAAAAGAGSGNGQGASGAGNGSGAAGSAQPFALSDDTHVTIGDYSGRYGDYVSERYMPRDKYDAGLKFLTGEAQKLEKAWTAYYQGRGQQPSQPDPAAQHRDRMGRVKQMPIVDGNTVADLIEDLHAQGLQPVANLVTQLTARIAALEKSHKDTSAATASLAQDRRNTEFGSWTSGEILGKLEGVKGLPDGVSIDAADPFLRELVSDIVLSHEQDSWGQGAAATKAVRTAVKGRIEAMIAYVTKLQQAGQKAATDRKRAVFTNTVKGGARPTGDQPYRHQKGDALASMLFGAAQGANT